MTEFKSLYNVNLGVLGHVDSGKTSLVAALSTTLSTAALDKHPQSKERGITLDLGFSSFVLPAPPEMAASGFDGVQFTLVDCPGHASLIRTVVGGAQIMDMMVLVVDVTKGIQTQTAECIVIGEITTDKMIVVLNKIDQLDLEKREKHIKKAKKLIAATFASTKFAGSPIIPVSARPPSSEDPSTLSTTIDDLKQALLHEVQLRNSPSTTAPFLFYVDHCFAIRGQGTILTGTVARGHLSVGDTLELPALKQQRKVKSMQIFRRAVNSCQQGDRVGICVTQLEAGSIERGLAAAPGSIPTFSGGIIAVDKVRFYPGEVKSMTKMHVIVGHHTVMAKLTFFGTPRETLGPPGMSKNKNKFSLESSLNGLSLGNGSAFDFNGEYVYQEELYGAEGRPLSAEGGVYATSANSGGNTTTAAAAEDDLPPHYGPQWAYAQFEEPVTAPSDSLVVGARLDADLNTSSCRIALSGRIIAAIDPGEPSQLQRLRVYKLKFREGSIERLESDRCTAVCRGMFGKDSDLTRFIGMAVRGPSGEVGILEGSFGKSGKFKVRFAQGLEHPLEKGQQVPVVLEYKRYVFDADKRRIAQ